jgi:YidC/Oxa1 family membrane protein insertase
MDWQRTFFLAAIAVVSVLLINEWGDFQERNQPEVSQETLTANNSTTLSSGAPAVTISDNVNSDIPVVAKLDDIEQAPDLESTGQQQLIQVTTDNLIVLIDTHGGDIVKVALPKHFAEIDTPNDPFVLLNRTSQTTYIAQSGLIGKNGTDTSEGRPNFRSAKNHYSLSDGDDTIVVDLLMEQGSVYITKRFTFRRGDNLINLEYIIDNQSNSDWSAGLFAQIKRDSHNPVKTTAMGMQPYLGAALTTTEENYKKLDFGDLADDGSFKTTIEGGWVAMVQHYFLSAWIPDSTTTNSFNLRKTNGDMYLLGFTSPQVSVSPKTQSVIKADFYAGPKNIDRLEDISEYLDLTVDYGWLWMVAKPLFHVLNYIYGILGSWGWSIIAVTVLIKAVFFPLSATSYRSMAKMRKFGPEMQRMKELYGDDRQRMSQEMMKLYKKEKINPLGGCLPILVQMPVFISLYWVLMESVELRHTPFFGWIADLSVKDPYFVLPLIMGVTMWIQQKLNPTPPDPTQARIMQMMPIVFTFMFLWFPAGLVLYWVVNNTLSITQQYFITKRIEAGESS